MLEAPIEDDSVDIAEARGWEVRKCVYLGRRSSPDRWMMKCGVLLLVEFKIPNKEPTIQQRREFARLEKAGFPVHHIDSVADFVTLLDRTEAAMAHG